MKLNLSIIILFIFSSCSNNGWTENIKLELISDCKINSKNYLVNKDNQLDVCECVVDKFMNDFSFDEYQKMTKENITNQSNPVIYNKLDIYILATIEKCEIPF